MAVQEEWGRAWCVVGGGMGAWGGGKRVCPQASWLCECVVVVSVVGCGSGCRRQRMPGTLTSPGRTCWAKELKIMYL